MSSAQKDSFTFPDLFPFSLSFSPAITLASTFSIMLNRNDKSRQFDLFPNWGEECSACRFLINALYQIENNLFDSLFWVDSFLTLRRDIEFFQSLFLQLLLDITFFSFILFSWLFLFTLDFFLIVNQLYIPGTNITSF